MSAPLSYAAETLRIEYYRLEGRIRAIPEEILAAGGYSSVRDDRVRQLDIIEGLLILGADVTTDMQSRRPA
jgi:hypothetical protein